MAIKARVIAARTSPPAVSLDGLTRRFGYFTAVDHVSFAVPAGEAFGLIGPNGAGKSTIVKMLTTLLPPSAGSATVAQFDIVRQPAQVRRHIGYVPQLLSADGALTARENLLLSARLYNMPSREMRARIQNALGAMELTPFADHLVKGFSGGMIRRLEITQSMLHHPAVLFMDEPTVGLDPVARRAVLDHVGDLRRRLGTAAVVTSHYMEEIEEPCDRVAMLNHGRIIAVDTPAALKAAVGPQATLDDVFVARAGEGEVEEPSGYRDVRQTRRAERMHG